MMNINNEWNLYQWIVNGVNNFVQGFCSRIESSYFMGGSARFGWNSTDSDIDFFIGITNEDDFIHSNLDFLIPRFLNVDLPPYVSGVVFQLYNKEYKIHLTFLLMEKWELLAEEHKRVSRLLEDNPLLLKMAKKIKEKGITGKDIYRSLISLLSETE
jgi:hypothetical protein